MDSWIGVCNWRQYGSRVVDNALSQGPRVRRWIQGTRVQIGGPKILRLLDDHHQCLKIGIAPSFLDFDLAMAVNDLLPCCFNMLARVRLLVF